MHIPSSMLHGAICPVTSAVAGVGVLTAAYLASKSQHKPSLIEFSSVTALVFGAQMLNFPISGGTSGHLLGGMLAARLLGIPFAVISLSLVLAIQAVFFGDGGISTLGANIINMSIAGVVLGALIDRVLKKLKSNDKLSLSIASWFSVMLATTMCSLELAIVNQGQAVNIFKSMLGVHAFIGLGEALLTVGLVTLISHQRINQFTYRIYAFAFIATLLSPLASPFPDGLEWVATKMSLQVFKVHSLVGLFPDYTVTGIPSEALSTILAGIAGLVLAASMAGVLGRLFKLQLSSVK